MKRRIAYLILLGAMLILSILCVAVVYGTEGIYVEADTETQTEVETEAEINEMTEAAPEDNFTYLVDDDGNARIVGYSEASSEVSIPAEIDGHPVTTIGENAFLYCYNVKKIRIPSSVTVIEANPFIGCEELTEFEVDKEQENFAAINGALFEKSSRSLIACPGGFSGTFEVPEGILSIGDSAFEECALLEEVLIPNTVTSIGKGAFSSCAALASVTIPESVATLGESAFYDCENLYEVDMPDSASAAIKEISDGLFYGCGSLYSIELPPSVTRIGEGAFSYTGLSELMLPDAVEEIGASAFSNCYDLYSIVIPGHVKKIGPHAFEGCQSVEEITMEEGIAEIGDYAFKETAIYEVSIPLSVKTIGNNPFALCGNLTEISTSVEQRLFSVVDNALYDTESKKLVSYCAGIYDEDIVVPEGVESIGASAFNSMEQITSVDLPSTLKVIEDEVFAYCTQLRSVSFTGNGLTSIGSEAFRGCSSLGEIRIPNSCSFIGDFCFGDCTDLYSVRLPLSLNKITMGLFEYCENLSRANLPEVTEIEDWAFNGCESLRTVNMPETVHAIGLYAFCECPITEVTIPSSVSYINAYTFSRCESLSKVTLPEQLKMICEGAFSDCSSLSEIIIPEGAVAIEDYAFSGCGSLHSVSAPDSMKYIGSLVFEDCNELYHMNLSDSITSPVQFTEEELLILKGLYDPYSPDAGETEAGDETEAETETESEQRMEDMIDVAGDQPVYDEFDVSILEGPGIQEDTFKGCEDLTLTVGEESYGKQYAITHGFDYNYPDSNDWLNM